MIRMGSFARQRVLACALCCLVSSCGTIVSRTRQGESELFADWRFDGPPFSAVHLDLMLLMDVEHTGGWIPVVVLSLPLDLVIDAVFAPIDLVVWSYDSVKHSKLKEPYSEPPSHQRTDQPIPQLWMPSTQRPSK